MSILHIITLIMNILSVCTIMILGILFCFGLLLRQIGKHQREDSRINRWNHSVRGKHCTLGMVVVVAAIYHSIWSLWRHGLSFSLGGLTAVFLAGVVGSYLLKAKMGERWIRIHKIFALLFCVTLMLHVVL